MLDKLFLPRSVAVVGASNKPQKVGNIVFSNLLPLQDKIKIFPINLKDQRILGVKAYKSLLDIKETVDVVIIAVPPLHVLPVLKQAIKKNVKFVIILTSDLDKVVFDRISAEEQIKNLSKKVKTRIIGPNCLGIANAHNNLNLTFLDNIPKAGNISLIMQSGAYATYLFDYMQEFNIGLRYYVSLGNKVDLAEHDFLEYMLYDKQTKVIGLYLESISDAKKLKKVLQKITPQKYVVALLSGKSKEAKKAALGHTNSVLPEYKKYKTFFEDNGVFVVSTPIEFAYTLYLFSSLKLPLNKDALVITNAGGPSVTITDLIKEALFNLTEINKRTHREIVENTPLTTVRNPLDLRGDATKDRYFNVLKILKNYHKKETFFLIATPQPMLDLEKLAENIEWLKLQNRVIYFPLVGAEHMPAIKRARTLEIFTTNQPSTVLKLISKTWHYFIIRKIVKKQAQHKKASRKKLTKITPISSYKRILYKDLEKIVKSLSLRYVTENTVKLSDLTTLTAKEEFARSIFSKSKKRVVVKLYHPEVVHLNKINAVFTDISSEEALKETIEKLTKIVNTHTLNPDLAYLIVQPYIKHFAELFVGITYEESLSEYTLALGWGGIAVEELNDLEYINLPTTKEHIAYHLGKTKIFKLLTKNLNTQQIKRLIEEIYKISLLPTVVTNLDWADFNPILINKDEIALVDIKIAVTNR